MALYHCQAKIKQPRDNFSIEAIHVNHGLQKDAKVFQEFVIVCALNYGQSAH